MDPFYSGGTVCCCFLRCKPVGRRSGKATYAPFPSPSFSSRTFFFFLLLFISFFI